MTHPTNLRATVEALHAALVRLGEHAHNCDVFNLDDEGRHCKCDCGFEDALSAGRDLLSAPEVAQDEGTTQPFYDLAWAHGARSRTSFEGDEIETIEFCPREFESFCAALRASAPPAPIDMVLYCPNCGLQHIDAVEWQDNGLGCDRSWDNPPHRSHLCHKCGCVWRPADVPANGVGELATQGKSDTWPVHSEEAQAQPASPEHRAVYAAIAQRYHRDRAAQQAAPEGWRMVPVEPTIRMMAAAGPAIRACYGLDGKHGTVTDVWSAMLDAAPQPPAREPREWIDGFSVVGMPEFDELMDYIYENGTIDEGVTARANDLVRAVLAAAPQPPAPAKSTPVQFPNRRDVDREISNAEYSKGLKFKDGKEHITLPGGTLRYMLALIDRNPDGHVD